MGSPCLNCVNPKDTDCMYCVNGSRYEGPTTLVINYSPTVSVRRAPLQGSEDTNFTGTTSARLRKQK